MTSSEQRTVGFHHHHTDAQLRAYRSLPVEQKLAWLEAAWQLTADFLPRHRIAVYQKLRRGEL